MKQDIRKMKRNLERNWENPQKLLEYIMSLDKQYEQEQQIAFEKGYKEGQLETVTNYSILFAYTIRKSGFGKKTLPLFMENIQIISKQLEEKKITLEEMREELDKNGIKIT